MLVLPGFDKNCACIEEEIKLIDFLLKRDTRCHGVLCF